MKPVLHSGDWRGVPKRLRQHVVALARRGEIPLGPGKHPGNIVYRREIPGYLLLIELWSEACLENGLFGDDAWEAKGSDDVEFDDEWLEIPGSLEGRLWAYQEESLQRRLRITRGPDAPPPGGRFVWEGWWPTHDSGTAFEAANMVVWKVPRRPSGRAAWRGDNVRLIDIEHDDGWETSARFEIVPIEQAVADLRDESGINELELDDAIYGVRPPLPAGSKILVINGIQLHPLRRGYGWGRRFVSAAWRWGRANGAVATMLFAGRMVNDGAPFHPVHFWQRMGYRVIAGSTNDDAVLIRKL